MSNVPSAVVDVGVVDVNRVKISMLSVLNEARVLIVCCICVSCCDAWDLALNKD